MWERFSFYGVAIVLVLFEVHFLHQSDTHAYFILATFMAISYVSCLFGGWYADRVTNHAFATFLGSVLVTIGTTYITLLPKHLAFGLTLMAFGVGLFKPNLASLVADLYDKSDPRLENGYTIYYMAINIGGACSVALSGFIYKYLSWQSLFGLSALASAIGTISIVAYYKRLRYKATLHREAIEPTTYLGVSLQKWSYWLLAAMIVISFQAFHNKLFQYLIIACLTAYYISYLIKNSLSENKEQTKKLGILFILLVLIIVYLILYMQHYTSINLYLDRHVDRNFFGLVIPTSTLQAINPIFVILLAPIMMAIFNRLNARNIRVSSMYKIVLGFIFMIITFLILYIATITHLHLGRSPLSLFLFVVAYFFMTISELLVIPMAFALIKKLALDRLISLTMGVYLLAFAIANYLSAWVASLSTDKINVLAYLDIHHLPDTPFHREFLLLLIISVLATLLSYITTLYFSNHLKNL